MSQAETRGIRIIVAPQYHPEHSRPAQGEFFFSYAVTIRNESSQAVTLLSRHWVIMDANGYTENVRGAGVVGQQPSLNPGDSFEYTSFCPLSTSLGSMHGSYRFVADDGEEFDARIAPFVLEDPTSMN